MPASAATTFTKTFVLLTAAGTFLYAVCAGFRDNYGIMLPYLVQTTGISYATLSFIIALGQLLFGAMQPVFGFMVLRTSARQVLCIGTSMMLAGLLMLPLCKSAPMMTLALGILLPSGTAAASFGIIMSCISSKLSEHQKHASSGFVASGIGIGICVLSPIMQAIIATKGLAGAILFLSIPVTLLIPVSLWLTSAGVDQGRKAAIAADHGRPTVAELFREALYSPAYGRVAFGFFTCGFHMAMIQTHLFSQLTTFGVSARAAAWALSVYGLGTIAGAVGSGFACARFPMPRVLGTLYSSRIAWVLLLLLPLPMPLLFTVIFMLGMTGVATVAPTSGLISKFFGPLRLATLFGGVYLLHQIGAFCSAWAGGICRALTGSYSGIWFADIALCLLAGLACFGIRHPNLEPTAERQ